MSHILINDPCILFALHRESAPFCRAYRPHRIVAGAPCRARLCGPAPNSVLVLETGVGQANVAAALDWLLATYRPRRMLFAGFAGALTDELHVGDVVLADEVLDLHGGRWKTTWAEQPADHTARLALQRGRLLTTDHLIGTVAEKRQLAAQHDTVAVEMESAHFAARCTQAGIPFGCVRAISDEVATSLSPALLSLLSGGGVSLWRLLAALARQPGLLPELWNLGRDTKRAASQLGHALGELMALPPRA